MSLFNKIRSLFRQDAPRALRNKPGGMAWIKGLDNGDGDVVLNGRAVRCVRLSEEGMWIVDPPQEFVVTVSTYYVNTQQVAWRGDLQRVKQLADDVLEPWKDLGDDAQDESLWQPHDGEKKKETV